MILSHIFLNPTKHAFEAVGKFCWSEKNKSTRRIPPKNDVISTKYFVKLTKLFNQKPWFTRVNRFSHLNKTLVHTTKVFFQINQMQSAKRFCSINHNFFLRLYKLYLGFVFLIFSFVASYPEKISINRNHFCSLVAIYYRWNDNCLLLHELKCHSCSETRASFSLTFFVGRFAKVKWG